MLPLAPETFAQTTQNAELRNASPPEITAFKIPLPLVHNEGVRLLVRCCVSPTTVSATAAPTTPSTSPGRVAESTLQGLLFSQILKPLAKDLGPVGEVAVESVVQRMFGPVHS